MNAYDTSGDGWNGSTYSVDAECSFGDSLFTYVVINNQGVTPSMDSAAVDGFYLESTESFTAVSCDSLILGCMDTIAENFNPLADFSDGNCEYIYGCMDTIAENYDSLATVSNATCEYINGCTDTLANNYSDTATFDDGSCDLSLILSCDSSNSFTYSGASSESITFDYSVAEGEIASLEIQGFLDSYYGDDVYIYDFE
jgi:hypothetical protein